MPKTQAKSLITRQLRKHSLSVDDLPVELASWKSFIERVEQTYSEYEEARISSENILEVSLREMQRLQNEIDQSNQLKLKEVNENLNLVLYASDLGTWDWNLITNDVSYDQRWCEMIGLKKEETPQNFDTFIKSVNPEDLQRVLDTAKAYIRGEIGKYEINFQMRHAAGHWIDVLAKGKITTSDATGKPVRFVGTHLDTSEEKQMLREMESQRLKYIQSAKMASLGELSAGVAHEINNPLAIIASSVNLLLKFKDNPEKMAAKIEAIKKSCERISKIVRGLKKFSRSDEKKILKAHSLSEIIKETATLTEAKARHNSTPVTYELLSDAKILCDEIEIEQVIVNLVSNAIDAVRELPEKWVKVSLVQKGSALILRIVDSGSGIPESVRNKLFQPFFTTKVVGEGTGLGLSITKGILEEHHATISIDTTNPNTCFEIRFNCIEVSQLAA